MLVLAGFELRTLILSNLRRQWQLLGIFLCLFHPKPQKICVLPGLSWHVVLVCCRGTLWLYVVGIKREKKTSIKNLVRLFLYVEIGTVCDVFTNNFFILYFCIQFWLDVWPDRPMLLSLVPTCICTGIWHVKLLTTYIIPHYPFTTVVHS